MIEINLVPDVKQELIKAQRVRNSVVSIAIVVGLGAIGVTVLLAVYVFGVQLARDTLAKNSIKSENSTLQNVEDLNEILTIQNQLSKIGETHDNKLMTSRAFSLLEVIIPQGSNSVTISQMAINSEEKTISFEAQAEGGYAALEAFRKTLAATELEYTPEGSETSEKIALASEIGDSDRSYGEDASGRKILRFSLSFTYPDELFARSSKNTSISGPKRTNVTDSLIGIPSSIFGERASDAEGDN